MAQRKLAPKWVAPLATNLNSLGERILDRYSKRGHQRKLEYDYALLDKSVCVCLSLPLCVYLSVSQCVCVCLSESLSLCLCLALSVCL